MNKSYQVSGMTCQGCVASVTTALKAIDGVEEVHVNLEKGMAEIEMKNHLQLTTLKATLPSKFTISENETTYKQVLDELRGEKTKLQQLKPLLLIFLYLFGTAFLLNFKDWNTSEAMLDFMGLFYVVFSFFKFLDLKGFPESFKMYDPLAKALPVYGWLYPFLELGLGLLFLMRFQIKIALIATIVILGITTVGVLQTLLSKKKIQCACLGTALKLPMTEATFIENTIMLVMAIGMLVVYI